MAVEGATGKLAITGALLCLGVAGVTAAASPGRLTSSDPGWWLVVVLAVGAVAVLVVAARVLLLRHPKAARAQRKSRERQRIPPPTALIFVVLAACAIAWAVAELGAGGAPPVALPVPKIGPPAPRPASHGAGGGTKAAPWLAIALALLILGGLVAVGIAHLRARRAVAPAELVALDPLAAAVEAALLDLEGESDPRRAVIKAYARTEAVLREHGLPRRPAEAPLEYLDRVLRDLGARAGAVDRLTDLFERAAFSQHEVGTDMRDEAVAVFHGLRDELSTQRAEQ